MTYDLDFERPLAEIEKRLQNLRSKRPDRVRPDDITNLERELTTKTFEIYSALTPWQRVQVARHKNRPYTADYIRFLFTDFFELHGDRRFADDAAIIGGLAAFDGRTVMIIGHQKGRDVKERQLRNFGSAHPEGYRKAQRLMAHAERFGYPVLTFIDTAGAYLNLEAEERGISEAIAESLYQMVTLKTAIIATVIGEGGSGGALALGVADRILMLENSIYTVASPEAAASILWKDASAAPEAAAAMKITAPDLLSLGLIDRIIPEPLGGAHGDHRSTAMTLRTALLDELRQLDGVSTATMLDRRYEKMRVIGAPASITIG